MKAIMSGVTSPRGMVRVPSTSKRAMIRGLVGAIFAFLEGDSSVIVRSLELELFGRELRNACVRYSK